MLSFFKDKPPECWVIKQVDDDLLHLCGRGLATARERPKRLLAKLHAGNYQGPVSFDNSGLVLNSRLFAALVPLDALHIDDQDRARWRDRLWRVSWVPRRCWTYEGRLTTQASAAGGRIGLISVEDVASIRAKARPRATASRHSLLYGLEPLEGVTTEKGAQQRQAGNRWSGPAAVGGRERRDRNDR
ncbi:hypothetical protein [Halomonas sp. NCCP-2165]|nr:hypothetical protein [Halomonas sp. NCCP-2165]GKW49757.1 hypothetical protein NCCP2165_19720 [Halomonas sp. NCCP-2165]